MARGWWGSSYCEYFISTNGYHMLMVSLQVFYERLCVIGGIFVWLRSGRHVGHHHVRAENFPVKLI